MSRAVDGTVEAPVHGGVGTYEYEPVTGRLEWSPGLFALLGLDPTGGASVEALRSRIVPDDVPVLDALVAGSLDPAGTGEHAGEYRVVLPGGDHRWLLDAGRTTFEGEGEHRRAVRVVGMVHDVTDRHRAQAAAQESEARLRRALIAARAGTFDLDVATFEVEVSDSVRAMFGFDPGQAPTTEQLLGRIHPDDRPEVDRVMSTSIERAVPHRVEYRVVHPSGRVVWVSSWAEVVTTPEGTAARLVGTLLDITRRQEADQALAESEARLRALFDSIDEGYCLCEMVQDEQGRWTHRFLEVNPLFEAMTGLVDAVGRTGYELVPDLEPEWGEVYHRVAFGGQPLRFEQGSEAMGRWFDVFAVPVEPRGRFALVFRDITERRRADLALRESEQRFRAMADWLPHIIWVHDADGGLEWVNRTYIDYFTVPDPELRGERWQALVHPDDLNAYSTAFARAVAERRPFHAEARVQRGDGEWRWVESWGRPRFDAEGTYLGHIGTSADVTERKEAEAELRGRHSSEQRARRRAELLYRLVSELEALEGLEPRAHRLVDRLVPRVADRARVQLPGLPPVVASAPAAAHGEAAHSEIAVALDLGAGEPGELRVGLVDPHRRPYDHRDGSFLRQVAERAGLVLGAARLREEEHRVAVRLQRALLPGRPTARGGVEVAARYLAASETMEVGGDWFETFELPDGRLGIAVGDVVGHSLEAAAAMGQLRAGLLALATRAEGPSQLLGDLHAFARRHDVTDFATACCAFYDPATGELTHASAGHPPLLVVDPDGRARWLDDGRSPPLAVVEVEVRPEASTRLEPGALVVAYSDGLVEHRRRTVDEGMAQLARLAVGVRTADPEVVCDALIEGMVGPTGGEDDVVVLCFRPVAVGGGRFRSVRPARAEELAPLRQELRAWMAERGIDGRAHHDVLLAVGEACANAIEHAYHPGPPGDLAVDVAYHGGGELFVRVRDWGSWRPQRSHASRGGRGTPLMRSIGATFARDSGPDGTVVSLRIPLDEVAAEGVVVSGLRG